MLQAAVAVAAIGDQPRERSRSRTYPWMVFAVVFGLMLSDYMSRQVLNAVFPQLKIEWSLTDSQLGLLSGIVGLMVGMLALPVALLADRWGRVKSVVIMALFWSLSTLGCALAQDYGQMLAARLFVGVGEAGYGCVGLALVMGVFPPSMRATLTGAFTSAGMFGSVLGMAVGGAVAARLGWRASFVAMALFGLVLILFYALTVTPARLARYTHRDGVATTAAPPGLQGPGQSPLSRIFRTVFSAPALLFTYLGSGLQLFTAYSVIAWMPSYLNRYHGLAVAQSALAAAVLFVVSGIGMAVCGILADRWARKVPERKATLAVAYCVGSCVLLMTAMRLPPVAMQFAIIAAGVFLTAGTWGPAGAMATDLVPASIHATVLATVALANNLLGAAPGPYLTGVLADRIGLLGALQYIPLVSLLAALAFAVARTSYARHLRRTADAGRSEPSPLPPRYRHE